MVTMDVDETEAAHKDSLPCPSQEVDELRYSRLIFTLGRAAVQAIFHHKVLILGCKGVGAEIAKNLVLSGIGGLGLVDDEVVSTSDLATQFLLTEADVGRNRAMVSAKKLKEMHPLAEIVAIPLLALERSLGAYHVLVATTGSIPYLVDINLRCRSAGVPLVLAFTRGLFSLVFADFGDNFSVLDESGVPAGALLVESITQDYPATVTVVEEQRHGLEDGDQVLFSGIKGMVELNRPVCHTVTVTGTTSFTILEDTRHFGRYLSGGYFHKVKQEKMVEFLSLEGALRLPKFCISDPVKVDRAPHLHVAFQAVSEYERRRGGEVALTAAGEGCIEEEELEEVLRLAREIWARQGSLNRGKGDISGSFGMEDTTVVFEDGREIAESGRSGVLESIIQTAGISEIGDSISKVGEADCLDERIVRLVAQGAHVELSPIAAITGGIAAQEVIKAVSRVFMPLNQWLYFDALECLPVITPTAEEKKLRGSRYDLQAALFGRKFQDLLGGLQWLVVGAGGLGSEVLKNLVMMGVGCSLNGNITVTDMDYVSRPNLVDQLLYQLDDVGRPKTPAAARALRNINPAANIHALQETFDMDTENIFDSSFFKSISGVFSTVDTAQSRLYIDSRCVVHAKPMIDGGKHGTKGSVQVFVPFQSEMYASSRDPPEQKDIPICTLKNFPYAIEHTLQWAVETFEILFKKRPFDVNAYLSNRDFQDSIRKSPPSSRLPILESLRDALLRHRPLSFEACVQWARLQFEDLFINSIKQLCFNFPPGMTTTAGGPFWSGTKRAPSPLSFDPLNSLHLDFIVAAANLQATVYGLKGCQDRILFLDILQDVVVPPFKPKEGVRIAISDNELRSMGSERPTHVVGEDVAAVDSCEVILQELPTPSTLASIVECDDSTDDNLLNFNFVDYLEHRKFLRKSSEVLEGYRLTPIEFEKDDESNYHVEFVASAASLRACNYGIPQSDKLQVVVLDVHMSESGMSNKVNEGTMKRVAQARPPTHEWTQGSAGSRAHSKSREITRLKNVVHCLYGFGFNVVVSQMKNEITARLIGGKVIPAIITATAIVGGLMCLELYKVLQCKPLTDYKHAYFNLALPFFTFAQPIKAVEHTVARRQGAPLSWTLWDRFELDCVGMSLEAFLAEFKRQQGLEITMISHGRSLLYAEFLPKKKLQDRLPLPLLELINVIGKVTVPATESTITFSISCTDVNNDDVEVPDVVARVR